MDKVFFVVCDGLGDRPIPEFGGKTPLEEAQTPNLDRLAKEGISGVMHTIGMGIRPGSDTAHLALFGYDPGIYYTGRGPFEAAGVGMEILPGDVCFRVNLGTVDKNLTVIDRRAGRIEDTGEFADLFNGREIDGVTFFLKKGTGHRLALVMRGKGLSAKITDADPHALGVKVYKAEAKEETREAKFTAKVLNKFIQTSHGELLSLPSNLTREKAGKLPANYLLVRGAGEYPQLPSFKEKYGLKAACIAGAGLYKGMGKILGMKVVEAAGATGKPDSNLLAKTEKAVGVSKDFDFIFIHFKGADSLGEDGDFEGKKKYIEKIDAAIVPLFQVRNGLILVTADHSTPCSLKAHSGDDVPVVIHSRHVRDDDVEHFNERECAKGRLGHLYGLQLMPIVLDLMGIAQLFGA